MGIFGLILAMFLTSQPCEFNETAHEGPYNSVKGLYKISFESYGQFLRKSKKVEKRLFLAIFGLILAMLLTSQPCEFNEIAHKGP